MVADRFEANSITEGHNSKMQSAMVHYQTKRFAFDNLMAIKKCILAVNSTSEKVSMLTLMENGPITENLEYYQNTKTSGLNNNISTSTNSIMYQQRDVYTDYFDNFDKIHNIFAS